MRENIQPVTSAGKYVSDRTRAKIATRSHEWFDWSIMQDESPDWLEVNTATVSYRSKSTKNGSHQKSK